MRKSWYHTYYDDVKSLFNPWLLKCLTWDNFYAFEIFETHMKREDYETQLSYAYLSW